MEFSPLFVDDSDELLQGLKLNDASDESTLEVIRNALDFVTLEMYRRLGETLVGTIQGYDASALGTANGRTKRRAQLAEIDWTKAVLLRELPMVFIDSGGNTRQRFNLEELTRDAGDFDIESTIKHLMGKVNEALEDILGTGNPGKGNVYVTDTSKIDTPAGQFRYPPQPGDTVFNIRNVYGNGI